MSAQRIVPPATAFRLSHGQKRPRVQNRSHLDFIRRLPCLITGRTDHIEACHIRYADPIYGKREVGKGEKPDDAWAVPLTRALHMMQHDAGNERLWWERHGIDPVRVALALAHASGDNDAAELILRTAREATRLSTG